MSGILNILKPPGMTSFDVVGYLRGVLKTKKIGHTGTLDPGAVGVLPICVGNATKAIEYMTEKDKLYRAELTLGSETDTQDSTGTVTAVYHVDLEPGIIKETISGFRGKYSQIPPMYSAVKIEGKKLYELARDGITVERKPREVEIYSINIINIKDNKTVLFDVHCSKGTYIRTLCEDIGKKLGCGGHMSFLIRMGAGAFGISSAVTLEEIADLAGTGRLEEKLLPVECVFDNMSKVILNREDEKRMLNGAFIGQYPEDSEKHGSLVRVYNADNAFIAIGEFVSRQGKTYLKSKKLFI